MTAPSRIAVRVFGAFARQLSDPAGFARAATIASVAVLALALRLAEAAEPYAAQINPELERMSNQLEYVRLRLRTQVKSQRLQRLAGGSGRKWPLSDSITAPRIDVRRSKPTSDFYPSESRRAFSEGVVTLRAFVDSEGCAERVQVLGLTGDARLVMAAVRWVLDGATFTP